MSPEPSEAAEAESTAEGPDSALPSVRSRVAAFAAIIGGGLGGAIIGYAFATLQCPHHLACVTSRSLSLWGGSVLGAGGVAVVSVLTLRALGEWRTIRDDDT